MLVQVHAAYVQDKVAVYHMAALVHRKAAIGVAIVGKAHVQSLLYHQTLQAVDMGGTAIDIDVEAIGRIADNAHIGTQRVEHRLGNRRSSAIGAIEANLHTLKREVRAGNKVGNIAVAALHVINCGADSIT